tara:strand:- start:178 stop:885 length:708 start_codon:yes stop_codon:yes gene_type:complete
MKKINTVAIITARKGSKRIKNKNLKLFFGKPIIYYSIKILKKSNIFDRIIVSTNSDLIEKISIKFGADTVIRRPDYISSNKVGTISVINHSIKSLSKLKIYPKLICCMYPVAPITKFKNLILVYNWIKKMRKFNGFIYPSTILLKKKNQTKIKFSYNKLIQAYKINKKDGIINDVLLDAGQFWFAKTLTWKKSKTIYTKKSHTFLIDEKISDINSMSDWKKVKKIYRDNRKKYIS